MDTSKAGAGRVLVADDQKDILEALRLLLKGEGFGVEVVSSPAAVLAAAGCGDHDLLLIDLNYARDTTSGQEGLDLISRLRAVDATLPVIVMTAWSTVDVAVEAMRRGARDFIQKPWDNARLITVVRTQIELSRALRRSQRLEDENRVLRGDGGPALVSRSAAMRPVVELIARVGPSDASVLITGENGTGKGVVAQALHAASARAGRTLVTVNTGGLAEGVFESELFGHVKGAYTDAAIDRAGRFEIAEGGTLFLDEIANLSPGMQARLLRVLETGEFERVGSSRTRRVDVRLLSATNADLQREVGAGRFRQDLLFRLNTVEIHLPPLRDRPEDIPILADHFLRQHARRYKRPAVAFGEPAGRALLEHPWPGNVRELDHAVERAVLMARGDRIQPSDLGLRSAAGETRRLEDMSLEEVELFLIRKTLARHDGNVSLAAKTLGLSRSAMYRRLQRHGL
jgi:DNA-binding NtrC family response regulator